MSTTNRSFIGDNTNGDADSRTNIAAIDTGSIVPPITRVSRACEPCRIRKTKCDIATKSVCGECIRRKKEGECVLREKARPGRRASKRPLSPILSATASASLPGTAHRSIPSPVSQPLPSPRSGQQMGDHSFSVTFDTLDSVDIPSIPTPDYNSNAAPAQAPFGSSGSPRFSSTASTAENTKASASNAVRTVEKILEHMTTERFGLSISLAIPSEHIFSIRSTPRMTLHQIGLAPGTATSIIKAREWIGSHFAAIHHNTPFLHLPQIHDIATRFFNPPSPHVDSIDPLGTAGRVGNDEAALLLAILALGSFRRETWDDQRKSYRNFHSSTGSATTTTSDMPGDRGPSVNMVGDASQSGVVPLTLFRLAQDELEELEYPSEAAVQALFLLHTFVSNTSMGRRSRDFVARAIMMAHEIGLNRTIPLDLDVSHTEGNRTQAISDTSVTRRRAVLYLYVYFSDVYLAALDNSPPLIKRHDYSPDLFDPILNPASTSGSETPSGSTTTLGAFVDLVRTSGEMLEILHGNKHRRMRQSFESSTPGDEKGDGTSAELILQLDGQMLSLRDRLGTGTFDIALGGEVNVDPSTRGTTAGKLLRQIHYNWFRIALRAPFLNHPLLGHSSLAMCASSALSLLHSHRYVINSGLLNLPWMQLRRITTAIHIVFIAYWKGEIPYTSAATAINNALTLLTIMSARWQSALSIAVLTIDLAKRSDLPVLQLAHAASLSANELPDPPPLAFPPAANPEADFGTLFQLASTYMEQNRHDQGDLELSQGLARDGTSLSAWLSSSTAEDVVWPDTSVDFWTDLIGPFG
ncbi:uncharacterized protein IL334_004503 [Kwoniella shivajii]|uniref:Zn(2)-C6 fungal-type domain-containing protein n=1 Tax=Kwoniella shivajii TaxID=564305 RepID=A0ABZ1D0W9_9TREE|nr:hypothetical protein IL334_004503 [Kwoniella shivajii]